MFDNFPLRFLGHACIGVNWGFQGISMKYEDMTEALNPNHCWATISINLTLLLILCVYVYVCIYSSVCVYFLCMHVYVYMCMYVRAYGSVYMWPYCVWLHTLNICMCGHEVRETQCLLPLPSNRNEPGPSSAFPADRCQGERHAVKPWPQRCHVPPAFQSNQWPPPTLSQSFVLASACINPRISDVLHFLVFW